MIGQDDPELQLLQIIAEAVGDIFEEMDIPMDTVDQMKGIFLALDGNKVKQIAESQQPEEKPVQPNIFTDKP